MDKFNFLNMSDRDVMDFINNNFSEFSIHEMKDSDFSKYLSGLEDGKTLIVKCEDGFAVLDNGCYEKRGALSLSKQNSLVFIYVNPDARGKGIGNLLATKAIEHFNCDLELICEGEKRKCIFEKIGFIVKSVYEDSYTMIYPRKIA